MTPLSSIKHLYLICLVFFLLFAFGCGSSDNGKCSDCQDSPNINSDVNFRIVDTTTKQDLFFGKNPKYKPAQLKINHIKNNHLDSTAAPIKIDSAKRLFNINVFYQSDADTIIMRIANLRPDTLYLSTELTNGCCSHIFVSSATLNHAVIYNTFDGAKKAAVKANIITITK